jgi:hypothetical protein
MMMMVMMVMMVMVMVMVISIKNHYGILIVDIAESGVF